jgi:hypothetical protein
LRFAPAPSVQLVVVDDFGLHRGRQKHTRAEGYRRYAGQHQKQLGIAFPYQKKNRKADADTDDITRDQRRQLTETSRHDHGNGYETNPKVCQQDNR